MGSALNPVVGDMLMMLIPVGGAVRPAEGLGEAEPESGENAVIVQPGGRLQMLHRTMRETRRRNRWPRKPKGLLSRRTTG